MMWVLERTSQSDQNEEQLNGSAAGNYHNSKIQFKENFVLG